MNVINAQWGTHMHHKLSTIVYAGPCLRHGTKQLDSINIIHACGVYSGDISHVVQNNFEEVRTCY